MASPKKNKQTSTKKEAIPTDVSNSSEGQRPPHQSTEKTSTERTSTERTSMGRNLGIKIFITLFIILALIVASYFVFPNQAQTLLKPIFKSVINLTTYSEEIETLKKQLQALQQARKETAQNYQERYDALQIQLQAYNKKTTTVDAKNLQTILENQQKNSLLLLHISAQTLQNAIYQGLPYRVHLTTFTSFASLYSPSLLESLKPLVNHQENGVFATSTLLSSFTDIACTNLKTVFHDTPPSLPAKKEAEEAAPSKPSSSFWTSSWSAFFEKTFADMVTISPISEETQILEGETTLQNQNKHLNNCRQWQKSVTQALQTNALSLAIERVKTPPNNHTFTLSASSLISPHPLSAPLAKWLSALKNTHETHKALISLFDLLPALS